MTKYVLNSGRAMNSADRGRKFFDEIFKGFGKNPKLLICNFALARDRWEEKFASDEQYFKEVFADINPVLTLALPDKFKEQIKENDAIFIHGGDDHLIQYWLGKYDLPKIWEGKVVAGSSAGSDVLAKHFWTCDWRGCLDGLGILPIKFLAHHESEYGINDQRGPVDWQKGYTELENYGNANLPIHALKEGEFEVFEIENPKISILDQVVIVGHISREINMFDWAYAQMTKNLSDDHCKRAIHECFLLHARTLSDFIWKKPKEDSVSTSNFDVIITKYDKEYKDIRWRIDKQLNHITWHRITNNQKSLFELNEKIYNTVHAGLREFNEKVEPVFRLDMSVLNKVSIFVFDILNKVDNQSDIMHARKTVCWTQQLKSDADEALLIAAVAHDIERAIHGDWKAGSDNPEAIRKHQDLSAAEIEKFLKSEGVDAEIIERVKYLVANHETGGDDDQNVLCDADVLSFFEDKALRRVRKWKEQGRTKEEMHRNMDYYFSRIITPKAKEIAQKWYDEAAQEIEDNTAQ